MKYGGRVVKQPGEPRDFELAPLVTRAVCSAFAVPVDDVMSGTKKYPVALTRQTCYYSLRKHARWSYSYIGEYYERDHSSVIHGVKTVQDMIDTHDPSLRIIQTALSSSRAVYRAWCKQKGNTPLPSCLDSAPLALGDIPSRLLLAEIDRRLT